MAGRRSSDHETNSCAKDDRDAAGRECARAGSGLRFIEQGNTGRSWWGQHPDDRCLELELGFRLLALRAWFIV
jgi:hypothetical protein